MVEFIRWLQVEAIAEAAKDEEEINHGRANHQPEVLMYEELRSQKWRSSDGDGSIWTKYNEKYDLFKGQSCLQKLDDRGGGHEIVTC